MASLGTNTADRAARDRAALDHLTAILRVPEWEGADYLEAIAAAVTGTGRSIEHTLPCRGCGLGGWYDETCSVHAHNDGPIRYRVKYETPDGEEAAPHDAFTSHGDAMEWYRDVIDSPAADLGAVYITSLTDDADHVIASHTFTTTATGDTATTGTPS
jgi:hypothetical protein